MPRQRGVSAVKCGGSGNGSAVIMAIKIILLNP